MKTKLKNPKKQLKPTQELLFKLLSNKTGVRQLIRKQKIKSLPIADSSNLPAVNRLEIYAGMYKARILDSLKDDYPGVLAVVGKKEFESLVDDYLEKYPSVYWTLRKTGDKFPLFIKGSKIGKKKPWLYSLAEFEIAICHAFTATDATILSREYLVTVKPNEWEQLRIGVQPSCRFHQFMWPVDLISEKPSPKSVYKKEPITILIWRKNFRVYYKRIPEDEAALLMALSRKLPFGKVCESFMAQHESLSENWVAQKLGEWVSEEMLSFLN